MNRLPPKCRIVRWQTSETEPRGGYPGPPGSMETPHIDTGLAVLHEAMDHEVAERRGARATQPDG